VYTEIAGQPFLKSIPSTSVPNLILKVGLTRVIGFVRQANKRTDKGRIIMRSRAAHCTTNFSLEAKHLTQITSSYQKKLLGLAVMAIVRKAAMKTRMGLDHISLRFANCSPAEQVLLPRGQVFTQLSAIFLEHRINPIARSTRGTVSIRSVTMVCCFTRVARKENLFWR